MKHNRHNNHNNQNNPNRESKKKNQINYLVNQNLKQLVSSSQRVIKLADSKYISYKDVQDLIGCINWAANRAEALYADLIDKIEINQFKATGEASKVYINDL